MTASAATYVHCFYSIHALSVLPPGIILSSWSKGQQCLVFSRISIIKKGNKRILFLHAGFLRFGYHRSFRLDCSQTGKVDLSRSHLAPLPSSLQSISSVSELMQSLESATSVLGMKIPSFRPYKHPERESSWMQQYVIQFLYLLVRNDSHMVDSSGDQVYVL